MEIFLSHIHEEASLALVMKEWIESSFPGLTNVFVSSDINDIPAGSRWFDELNNALDTSNAFLVLCSPQSISRPWINFEVGCAWNKDVPVLIICHSGMSKSDLPKPISEFQALTISSKTFIDDLLASLKKHLKVDVTPRIDKKSMIDELTKSIKKINYTNLEEKKSELTSSEIDKKLIDVLKRIADLGDKGYSLEDLSIEFGTAEPKMEYYLDELRQLKLLDRSGALMGIPPGYYLTKEGRKYLVEHDLL